MFTAERGDTMAKSTLTIPPFFKRGKVKEVRLSLIETVEEKDR